MKLLTIVIPCYNVEQYLAECLDSILDTKYNDVLEVLAINDGSKDGTLALAREYEARFPEILRVIDKPNGGWGTVINLAIATARGRYFKILDSDDWFDTGAFSEFMGVLSTVDVDVFGTIFTEIYPQTSIAGVSYKRSLCNKLLKFEDYMKSVNNTNLPMTNITVRTNIFEDNIFQLPPRYYGDLYFIIYILAHIDTIYLTNINLYRYRKELTTQSTSVESYIRNYKDFLDVSSKLIGFYAEKRISLSLNKKKILKKKIVGLISFAYKLLMSKEYCGNMSDSERQLIDFNKYLKHSSPDLYLASFKITNRYIPYVLIWRLFNINLFKLR